MSEIKCSYFGCNETIAESEITSKDLMKFCNEHLAELNNIIDKEDAKGILRFWVKSSGGAERLAKSMVGEYKPNA
jgi:hypothetical protein